ncbi:protein-glutamate methylesterase/protein-glutamine glutaminase [Bacillus alkalicellulosilyticus]|uniref:protein-glutamate methylesterase/protein-glutamine glutaminase n=1 Tax=Alkalihalobacterium alkalicellulosilyticum TaxID=1912214 RepID=UPI0009984F8B|nr:chemotaxis response regulator protein-glutamate methylesterase [Bacillus alkalicellulosilyticus]
MTKEIRVLVVDDSAFMRKVITEVLEENRFITVVGTARNGKEALVKLNQCKPNVITLDVEMPVMDGLTTLKEIMSISPVPVVMVSSTTTVGAENTLLAMEYGAVDFVAKTSAKASQDIYKIKDILIEKVQLASTVNVNQLVTKPKPMINKETSINHPVKQGIQKLIAIGTSTGGPKALQAVLTGINKNIVAPIVIVQHMPAGFTKSLAMRLDTLTDIRVKEAEDGDILQNGWAYIAPGGYHIVVKNHEDTCKLVLDQSAPRKGHRPSVDVMFESIAEVTGYDIMTVIMTGMGSDGTEGLIQLKKRENCYSIAESEKTSIVYGMPKSAVLAKVVDEVVDLGEIASKINRYGI